MVELCHPTHMLDKTTSSYYYAYCVSCKQTDLETGWGKLALPCPMAMLQERAEDINTEEEPDVVDY